MITTLHTLFTNLTYGEFAQLEIGNFLPEENESEPDPKAYAQLSSHVNLGLAALYSEFFLASDEIYVTLHEEITIYTLSSNFAASNDASAEDPKYIADTAENPFTDNILKIEEIYDEVGNRIPLNDPTEDLSVFTTDFRSIQVPWPNDYNTVAVMYRASHDAIVYTADMDPAA
ncbi:MAG: hypothetical protein DRH97_03830, partial [Chloroflexi bacterium]